MQKFMSWLLKSSDPSDIARVCPTDRVFRREPGAPTPPPFLLFHGTVDNLVDVRQSLHLAELLGGDAQGEKQRRGQGKGKGMSVMVKLPVAHHAFDITPGPRALLAARCMADFLSHHAAKKSD